MLSINTIFSKVAGIIDSNPKQLVLLGRGLRGLHGTAHLLTFRGCKQGFSNSGSGRRGGLVVSLSPGLNMDSSLSEAFDNIIELKPTCSSRLVIGTTFGAILVLPILPILKILGAIDKMISIRAHNLVDGVATVLEGVEVHETGHKIFESDLIPRLV